MGGYVHLSSVLGTLFKMVVKVWAYSGIVVIFCFLIYFFYGGIFAFVLLLLSFTGEYLCINYDYDCEVNLL